MLCRLSWRFAWPIPGQMPRSLLAADGGSEQKFRLDVQIRNQQTIHGNYPSDCRGDAEIVQGEKVMRKNEGGTLGTSTFGRSFGE